MKALEFFYVNHKGETHKYKIIPVSISFGHTGLYEGQHHAWIVKGLVLTRSNVVRNVMRTFALVKMSQVSEVPIETG